MKVNQVSKWEGPLTRIKTWREMCVFMFSNLLYQKFCSTKRCVLSKKSDFAVHLRSTSTWSQCQRSKTIVTMGIGYRLEGRKSSSSRWSHCLDKNPVIDIQRSRCWLAAESRAGSDGGERKQLSKTVRSHGWAAPGSVATTLKKNKKNTWDGGFLCNWLWGRREIKMEYIYSTQLTWLLSLLCVLSVGHSGWMSGCV